MTVFDVGQGDAVFVSAPGCRMLIDTGKSDPFDTLLGYFRRENIFALDVVLLTHGDEDHVGEIVDLDQASGSGRSSRRRNSVPPAGLRRR
ncbi:MAG: MBL fold metallo-hydrolase [Bacillus subtilis]|nr:MBL fold metallo-hydrolase [Bacillus subtilis]